MVEDDRQVRALVVRSLRRLGYRVHEASSPPAAEDIAAAHHRDIALVITDVVMPGMNGPDLARRLRSALPSARVLYMTGYAGDALRQSGALGDGAPTLEKPFTIEALARRVREVLDAPQR